MFRTLRTLSAEEFERLTAGTQVLEQDRHGPKVLLRPDRRVIKLFRRKRLLSSGNLIPYASRFFRNAGRLQSYGIPSLQVDAAYRCPAVERDLVIYPWLPGQPLREVFAKSGGNRELVERLATFIALLHYKGIYFRSLHLGNVLLQPDGELALIDVADLRFKWLPMGPISRARNFRHLFRYAEDRAALAKWGLDFFFRIYLLRSGISPWAARVLMQRLFIQRGTRVESR